MIDPNQSAFPEHTGCDYESGMSIRMVLAGLILAGTAANPKCSLNEEESAKWAILQADMLIAEFNRGSSK